MAGGTFADPAGFCLNELVDGRACAQHDQALRKGLEGWLDSLTPEQRKRAEPYIKIGFAYVYSLSPEEVVVYNQTLQDNCTNGVNQQAQFSQSDLDALQAVVDSVKKESFAFVP